MKKALLLSAVAVLSFTAMTSAHAQVTGGDADKHGCIGSAGYVWDETLSECIRPFDPEALFRWATKHNITTTTNYASFAPDRTITRDEVAVLVERIINSDAISGGYPTNNDAPQYTDYNSISEEFRSAVRMVQNYGIMKGNNGRFLPKDNLTTYEAIIILSRATLSGEIHNFNDAMDFIQKLGVTIERSSLTQPILRKDFFQFIYAASVYEKEIIKNNEESGATR